MIKFFWQIIAPIIGIALILLFVGGNVSFNSPKPAWEVAKETALAREEVERAENWTKFTNDMLTFFKFASVIGAFGAAGFLGSQVFSSHYEKVQANQRQREESLRQRDGSFALIERVIEVFNPDTNQYEQVTAIFNPNQMIAPGAYLNPRTGAWIQIPTENFEAHVRLAAVRAALVAPTQAAQPGDLAHIATAAAMGDAGQRITINNRQLPPPASWAKQQLALADRAMESATPAPPTSINAERQFLATPMTWDDAWSQSTANQWVLGYNPAPWVKPDDPSRLCIFDVTRDCNVGIVGSIGAGKTVTTLGILIQAIAKARALCLILDGKEGADLSVFREVCDWQLCTPATLKSQIDAIGNEYMRRVRLLKDTNCANITELNARGNAIPRVVIVLEEFTDVWNGLQHSDKADVQRKMSTIINKGRYTGIHWVVVAQQPQKAPDFVKTNIFTRFCVAYKLDPSQAGVVNEYRATQVANRGEFANNGVRYYAWDVTVPVRQLLPSLPRLPDTARLLPPPTATTLDLLPAPAATAPTLPAPTAAAPATSAQAVTQHQEVSGGFEGIIQEAATGNRLDPNRFNAIMAAYFAEDPANWGAPPPAKPTGRDCLKLTDRFIAFDLEHYGIERAPDNLKSLASKLLIEWRIRHWQAVAAQPPAPASAPETNAPRVERASTTQENILTAIREQYPDLEIAKDTEIRVLAQ